MIDDLMKTAKSFSLRWSIPMQNLKIILAAIILNFLLLMTRSQKDNGGMEKIVC